MSSDVVEPPGVAATSVVTYSVSQRDRMSGQDETSGRDETSVSVPGLDGTSERDGTLGLDGTSETVALSLDMIELDLDLASQIIF